MPVGAAVAIVGAGTAIYGADQNRKLTHQAQDANKLQNDQTNQLNYQRYLLGRGEGPGGAPVNTKLPLWASIRSVSSAPRVLVRKGTPLPSGTTAVPHLVNTPMALGYT